jgi:cytochrome c
MFKSKIPSLIVATTLPLTALADCDLEAGSKQYNKCVACHSTQPGEQLMGPSLHGLMGRKAGSVQGFTYSLAMEKAGFTWSEETLDAFLVSPSSVVPGTSMPFGGIRNPDQRSALGCYIRSLPEQR